MKEKAAYLKGLIDGLGIDENTKEGKVIKAMSELLSEMAETVDSIDEDVTHAYDQINDLSEELEDPEDDEAAENDGPVQYEVTCPACGATSVVDEEALLDGDPVCPSCGKPLDFEVTEE